MPETLDTALWSRSILSFNELRIILAWSREMQSDCGSTEKNHMLRVMPTELRWSNQVWPQPESQGHVWHNHKQRNMFNQYVPLGSRLTPGPVIIVQEPDPWLDPEKIARDLFFGQCFSLTYPKQPSKSPEKTNHDWLTVHVKHVKVVKIQYFPWVKFSGLLACY